MINYNWVIEWTDKHRDVKGTETVTDITARVDPDGKHPGCTPVLVLVRGEWSEQDQAIDRCWCYPNGRAQLDAYFSDAWGYDTCHPVPARFNIEWGALS